MGNVNFKFGILSVFLVFSILMMSSAAFAQTPTFRISDVFPYTAGGQSNLTVRVCSNSQTVPVNSFNFSTSLLDSNISMKTSIVNATITQCGGSLHGAQYNSSNVTGNLSLISQGSCDASQQINPIFQAPYPQCADFVLNVSWADSGAVVNVTAFNESLGEAWNPGSMNASVVTINQFLVKTQTSTGTQLGSIVLMGFDNSVKSFASFSQGPALTAADGYFMQHCSGITLSNGTCVGQTALHPRNSCVWHGTQFYAGGQGGGSTCLDMNNSLILGYDFISSNTTNATTLFNQTATLLFNRSAVVSFVDLFSVDMNSPFTGGPPSFISLDGIKIYDDGGSLVFNQSLVGTTNFVPPAFLEVNRVYTIELNLSSEAANRNYSFISNSNGIYGAIVVNANTTGVSGGQSYTIIRGQVVNSSDVSQGIGGAVVYAKFHEFDTPPMGVVFVNSTTTDSNGLFSLRVPSTQFLNDPFGGGFKMPFPAYDLFIVSNWTRNSVPLFFPTVDDNGERGHFAQGSTMVLKPTKLKDGGLVNLNVTLNNATGLITEISRFSSAKVTGVSKDALSSKMSMLKIFQNTNLPSYIVIPIVAPTGSLEISVIGQNQTFGFGDTPIMNMCMSNASLVSAGTSVSVNCSLTVPGYVNLNVSNCNSLFDASTCTSKGSLGNFDFWFSNILLIKNSTGHPKMSIDSSSFVLENILRSGSASNSIGLPLPEGSYQLSIVPAFDFSEWTEVHNTTNFVITAGGNQTLDIRRARAFNFNPMFPSLTLNANNHINITVSDFSGPLSNSHVNVTAQLIFPNKSAASNGTGESPVLNLTYDPTNRVFYNVSANFSQPAYGGLTAGKYTILFNMTHSNASGSTRYTTTFLQPNSLSDFAVGIDLGGFTFGTGQTINGKVFAFDLTKAPPDDAVTGALKIEIYDETGTLYNSSNISTSVTNGEGSFSVPAPRTIGFYNLIAVVNASGRSGMSENWLQVSDFSVKIATDRFSYQPTDKVFATIEVRNASTSAGISSANVEATIGNNQNPVIGTTDSNGKAVLTLDPSTVTSSGQWSFGFNSIKVKISKDTGTKIINLDTFYGFNVRGFEFFVQSEKPSWSTTESVLINVFIPPGTTLTSAPTAAVDGNSSSNYTATQLAPDFYQFNLGAQKAGRHSVKVTAATSSGSQSAFTGFEVIATNIQVQTRRGATPQFEFNANEIFNLTVTVINVTTGGPINNAEIVATLYKANPPNDINVTRNVSYTNANGYVAMNINASNRGGFHYILVNVTNSSQTQYAGIMVSTLKVNLLNSTPANNGVTVTRYSSAPGSTVNIFVNATSGGVNVADGSIVTVRVWAFGRPIEFTNTTTSGNSTISFEIPSFAPKLTYGLDVIVADTSGNTGVAPRAELVVTGGSALKLDVESNAFSYTPSSSGTFTAVLTYENGTAAQGHNITFERGLPGGSPTTVGTSITTATGAATLSVSNMGTSDGRYFVRAYITNETTVSAFSGYTVNSLVVNLSTNGTTFDLGGVIGFNVTVTNASTGGSFNASTGTGFIMIFDKERGIITTPLTVSNSQPYTASLTIPNDQSAVGTYGVGVEFTYNGSKGFDFTLISVVNASERVTVSVPSSITAGQAFNVTINSSATSTGHLSVFSPVATSTIYDNSSISMTGGTAQNITLNITDTGVYVFNFRVSGIGANSTIATIIGVASGATLPAVWTGSGLSTNSTSFSSGGTVYLLSNVANSTARIMTVSGNTTTTVSLPLTQNTSTTYYTTFTPSATGSYYVRLDKSTASGIATSMFTVS
ncbi:MAG: hypothetical protein HYS62_01255 [Candidatus Aenigmarchaeota archaeon]|nr:hypothetical protein [Candidatus Aenigmarchaeota archaeon]